MALCAALGLSLVLPYAYPCARHCVAPVRALGRSLWAIGVRSALPILCVTVRHLVDLPSAYAVGP
nr:MAG TPA: hypothetical protein [Caudoviricetes sp.]